MKVDVMVNHPSSDRTFPVVAVIGGVPCIRTTTMDESNLPSETVKVFYGEGGATPEHWTPNGPAQEVHEGDMVGVVSRQTATSPTVLNAYRITAVNNAQVFAEWAIL